MSIIFVTGDHPRNFYMAKKVAETGRLSAIIVQTRGAHIPEVPNGLGDDLTALYQKHFALRRENELAFFGENHEFSTLSDDVICVESTDELNGDDVEKFVRSVAPSILLSYNAGIISDRLLTAVNGFRWNIHPGLTPWYRGASTHFWASYMLEPQMTGVTLHELSSFVDGGDVIHQATAPLVRGDGLHAIACRAVHEFGRELGSVLNLALSGKLIERKPQKSLGKTWLKRDWRPEHLHHIYNTWEDRIVDYYLDGVITGRPPVCFRKNFEETK